MSYILDALRKAERDHQVSRVPTLATAHGGVHRRRASWIWPVAIAVLALGVVVGYLLHWAPPRAVQRESVGPVAPPAPVSSAATSAPGPTVPLAGSPQSLAGGTAAPAAGPVAASGSPTERPVTTPPAAASPPKPPHLPSNPRQAAGRASASATVPGNQPPVSVAAPAAPSAPPPPIDRDPARVAQTGQGAVVPPAAPQSTVPAPAVPQPQGPAPAPAEDGANRVAPPAPAQGPPQLALDVLVYSDVPADRFVFINGRKYVEGQTVTGGAVVEQITPDGALLRQDGKQIVLRPKLNPYARPGSP